MSSVDDAEKERLIERAASAHRDRDPRGQIVASPAFHDLDEEGRLAAYAAAVELRRLEAALDPEGQNTTVRAILRLVRRE
ncbi:MAG: hypothetical protein U0271_29995 [Polyangiaceae bacterium]